MDENCVAKVSYWILRKYCQTRATRVVTEIVENDFFQLNYELFQTSFGDFLG